MSAPMSLAGGKPVLAIFSRDDEFNDFLENFSLQLRGFTAKSFTDVDVKSNATPLLNDFGVAMFYDLGKHTAIGVEIGQENFLQKYTRNRARSAYRVAPKLHRLLDRFGICLYYGRRVLYSTLWPKYSWAERGRVRL